MTWGQLKSLIHSRGIADSDDIAYLYCGYDYPHALPDVDIRRWCDRKWPKPGEDNWYIGIHISIPTTSPFIANPEPAGDEEP